MTRSGGGRADLVPPLVVLGGTYNALSAARAVGARGVQTYVLSDGRGSPAVRASKFVREWYAPPDVREPGDDWMRWLATGPRGAVLIPAGDEGLDLIADRRAELVELGYRPVEANDKVVTGMLDKVQAATLAASVGIPAPRSRQVDDLGAAVEAGETFGYPCAVKPRHSHRFSQALGGQSSLKAVIVDDRAALASAYWRLARSGADLTVTEFVVGADDAFFSYYTYLDDEGRPLAHFTKRKLRQFPAGAGLGSYHETVWDPEAAELGLALFQRLEVRGLANVEFKRDERDGELKFIEANLRLTAADDLVRRAGIDFAWLAYSRAAGDVGQPSVDLPSRPDFILGLRQWLPLRDLRALLQRHDAAGAVREWSRTLLNRPYTPIFAVHDPGPTLAHGRHLARRFITEFGGRWREGSDGDLADVDAGSPVPASAEEGGGRTTMESSRLSSRGMAVTMRPRRPEWTKGAMTLAREADELRRLGPALYMHQLRDRTGALLSGPYRNAVYTAIWRDAATELGADISPWGDGYLDVRLNAHHARLWQHLVPLGDPIALRLAGDKATAHELLSAVGVPVPPHTLVHASNVRAAEAFVTAHGPCVAKPGRNTGAGSGVTGGITTSGDLLAARFRSGRYDAEQLLLEATVRGSEYRLLVLGGTPIGAVLRRPPSVVGDGRSTVADLVAAENARRCRARGWAAIWPLTLDLDAALTLRAQGLTASSVLPDGRVAQVHVGSSQGNDRDADVLDVDDPGLAGVRAAAMTAAAAFDADYISVEVITEDPSVPLQQSNGAVIEVNTTPGIAQHYIVSDPSAIVPVAVPVLRHLLDAPDAPRSTS